MLYLVIILSSFGAGVIQTVTGFGAGIFLMLFLPLFYPVLSASALCASVTIILNVLLVWQYRKHIHFRLTVIPSIPYILVSTVIVYLAPYLPKVLLTKILGGFMVILSLYFLFAASKWEIKASIGSAVICASIAGCTGGLFGIGGPPMVIYFLAATREKEEYLGTIQFFFFIAAVENMIVRIARGILTPDLALPALIGIAAVAIGKAIGQKIIDRIDGERMKKVIYVFLGIAGLLNLF